MVTTRRLIRSGVDRRWIARRLAAGIWQQPFPGVVDAERVAGTRGGLLRAALLYGGPDARLSHETAAAMWGMVPWNPDLPIHLTVPHGRRLRQPRGLVIHQSRRWHAVEFLDGFPVTTPAATLTDLAAVLSANDFRCVAADAVRLGIVRVDELASADPGKRRSRTLVRLTTEELWAGAASGPEAVYWRGVYVAGLPLPELNVAIETEDGWKFVDGLWRRHRLGAEIDGRSVHAQAAAFDADRWRQNGIQLEGVLLMRFAASAIFLQLDRVLDVTASFLRARAAEFGLD